MAKGRSRGAGRRGVLIAAGAVGLGLLAGAGWLGARAPEAGRSPEPASRALPVSALQVRLQDRYAVSRVFTGRVEAARRGEIGFELDGRLVAVLVEEGDAVIAGQPLARLDTARLRARRDELEAARDQAEADRTLARITVDRLAGVVESGGVSRQGLDEARESLRVAEAALRLAQSRLATIDVELQKSVLRAPFGAVVTRRLADEGRVLSAGVPVLELVESARRELRVGIAGRLVEEMAPGQRRGVRVGDASLQATVKAVLPTRAAGTRTVDVILGLDGAGERVRPGDLVTLSVEETIDEAGFWVPLDAIAEGRRGLWNVYALESAQASPGERGSTHAVVPHVVEVIHQTEDRVFVRGTLREPALIVAGGLHRVVPGQQVRVLDDENVRVAGRGDRHDVD